MNCGEAIYTIKNLRLLKQVYYKMFDDPNNELFSQKEILRLIKYTDEEILRLTELLDSMELLDSYDQNTGEPNKIYRVPNEVDKLKKIVGGKK